MTGGLLILGESLLTATPVMTTFFTLHCISVPFILTSCVCIASIDSFIKESMIASVVHGPFFQVHYFIILAIHLIIIEHGF